MEISQKDAQRLGINEGDTVNIDSRRGSIAVRVRIPSNAVDGTAFIS
jgi:formylmethanofuran dehydrogenase subunit D